MAIVLAIVDGSGFRNETHWSIPLIIAIIYFVMASKLWGRLLGQNSVSNITVYSNVVIIVIITAIFMVVTIPFNTSSLLLAAFWKLSILIMQVKRLHDLGQGGIWSLMSFIPFFFKSSTDLSISSLRMPSEVQIQNVILHPNIDKSDITPKHPISISSGCAPKKRTSLSLKSFIFKST
mgnify:CR=1 FL=1